MEFFFSWKTAIHTKYRKYLLTFLPQLMLIDFMLVMLLWILEAALKLYAK